MEGVPKLAMLRTAMKTSPEKTDFSRKIKWQIREHFNEDPNGYANEIRELETLRAAACHPPQDFSGCSLLKKYYCQLHFLQNRFSFEETGRDEVYFTWNDIYTGMAYSTTDIKHEMACILYNIGALHMNLGAVDSRQTGDGMKISCSHFQCAAWAFQQINDKYSQPRETDLCHEIVKFFGLVSLAQAQECILEKSIIDGRKPGIVAKVAAQIVDYYKSALKVLDQGNNHPDGNAVVEVAGNKSYKAWKRYSEFKMTFHQCVALLYMGIHSEDMQKMGERLAYFQAAIDKLTEATKLGKKLENQTDNINDAISFVHDVVGGKLKAAEKENEFVYHEKVPDRSSLPEIKGASLVKGTPFDIQDPDIAGQDIFHRLVPMEAHEASSLYSEEKAKLLRRIGGNIDEKDQELALFLTSLQVDQLRVHLEPTGLPQDLVDRCAAFSVESNVAQSLIEAMGKLSSVYTDVESSLAEVQHLLQEEQENEKIYQSQTKRPPSMILKELSLEAGRYAEAHAKAADSNMLLHKAINSHLSNLRTLCLPLSEIQAQLPTIQVLESSKDQAAIKELQRLLDKVEEMRKQRQMLYTQLREALQADDITKLATHQADLEALFTQELAKHQRLTSLIEQNLSAQEKILVALTEANARYADTRRTTADIQQRRGAMVSSLLASADAYPDLMAKCQKGLEFYRKMETNVTKLVHRLRSVCRVQQEEREQQEAARERNRPSVTRTEFQDPVDVQGGPKLKDFLHLMKKDRTGIDSPTIPTPPVTLPSGGLEGATPFNYSYQQRPTPVGAEQSDHHAQSAYMADGNSYYYRTPHASGFAGPMYHGGFPTDNKPSSFATSTQQPVSAASYSYPALSQHNVAVADSIISNYSASVVYPTPTSLPQTSQPNNYLGQPTSGESNVAAAASTYRTATPPHHQPTSYYGQQQVSNAATSYQASNLSAQQLQTYPSAMGQPVPNLPGMNTSAPQYLPQSFPSTGEGYMGHHINGGGTSSLADSSAKTSKQETIPASSLASSSFAPVTTVSSQQQMYGLATGSNQMPGGNVPYPTASTGVIAAAAPEQPNQYPYYPGSMYGYPSTSTTNSLASSHQYGPANVGYQHGTTGTTNTAPSSAQSLGQQMGSTHSASGMGQYQHYPYYPSDPASSYYASYYNPSNLYSSPNHTLQTPAPLAPTPVSTPAAIPATVPTSVPYTYPAQPAAPSSTFVPAPIASGPNVATPATIGEIASNVELLSLLDLSVPMAPVGGLLEPQPRETPLGADTHGTTTLTNSTTKSVMCPSTPAATPDSTGKSASITSPLESFPSSAVEAKTPPVASHKDPLADAESVTKLAAEVEKLGKLVDGLTRKSLKGPTSLDTRWKEVMEQQERETARHSISVARCYPMKNRLPDVLPYDHNRVELPTTKDDYINATHIPALSAGAPSFIATQAPLPCTQQDFWTMVWQQSIEIVVCLLSDAEMPKTGASTSAAYWPVEKGRDVVSGPWTITLQSSNIRPYSHERILGITKQGESKQRVVIHLQFTAWPGSSFPASPAQFLQFASEVFHFWQQQRSRSHPVVVHCLAGAGRTGLFCLLCTALPDLAGGHGLLDVTRVAAALCQHRRNMFRDREHLLFAYQALLYHAQDLLMKRGILSGTASLQGSMQSSPIKKHHPSQDFIQSSTPTYFPSSNATPVLEAAAEALKSTEEKPEEQTPVEKEQTEVKEPETEVALAEQKKTNLGALAILDPANFTLEGGQPSRHRVTKESFKNPSQLGMVSDPTDPLSQLDPLWSLAK